MTKDGQEKWIGHQCRQVYDEDGNKAGRRVSCRDITSQKKLAQTLKETIEEKDFLMRELNHRIKNNLLMINSLISLKAASMEDKLSLSDISSQIDTIRVVHEKLYKSGNVARVNFREYIEDLLPSVFSFFNAEVKINNEVKEIEISTKSTITLGLIINEIATNAIKYGFTENEENVFSISVQQENEENVLVLSNNGKPFPEDISLDNTGTLGLRLISELVKQLMGTVVLDKSPHPVFTIRFPAG